MWGRPSHQKATKCACVQFETARARLMSWHLIAADLEATVVVLDSLVIVVQAVATYECCPEGLINRQALVNH